jgi:hypothetical protein
MAQKKKHCSKQNVIETVFRAKQQHNKKACRRADFKTFKERFKLQL